MKQISKMRKFWMLFCLTIYRCETECNTKDDCLCIFGNPLELQCPRTFQKDGKGVVIQIKEGENLSIRCSGLKIFPMNFLPNVTLSQTRTIYLSQCPPPENFRQILDHFSLNVKVLQFENSTVSLTKKRFEGLQGLDGLKLNTLKVEFVESNVFDGVPNLTSLEMQRNTNLTLDEHIFDNLQKLNSLYLADNGLEGIADGLFRNLSSLTNLRLWNNSLEVIRAHSFSGLSNLTSLDLNSNKIGNISEEAFRDLTELSQINLSGNKLKHLSDIFRNNKKIVRILMVFNPGVHLSDYLFANLTLLEEVDLTQCNLDSIPGHIFENSTNLRVLKLGNNKLKDIPSSLFKGLIELQELSLEDNLIDAIVENAFKDLTSLEKINLQKNKITVIHHGAFSNLENLRSINVSYNEYSGNTIHFIKRMENLEDLDLSHNLIEHVKDVFSTINLLKLERLDMSHNRLKEIKLVELQPFRPLRVKLDHNNITGVNLDDVDMISGSEQATISLDNNPIECNCNTFKLLQYLKNERMFKILTKNIICANPPSLKDLKMEALSPLQLTCRLEKTCPDDCACVWRPSDKSVVIDCSNKNLTEFPRINLNNSLGFNHTEIHLEGNNLTFIPRLSGYDNITKLFLSYNKIKKVEWLPPKLEVLHLDNNELSYLSRDVLKTLNTSSLANLTLDNNRWSCDCAAVTLANFLRTHARLIKADNVNCSNNIGRLINLSHNDLCPEWFILYLIVPVLTILVVLTSLIVVFYRYQKDIKVWLYAHGWFLWFFPEEKRDSKKEYDIFLSYSDIDKDFVDRNLLPVLKGGPNNYQLCEYHKNSDAGEFITTNIMKLVQQSCRTLIVLSPNFLESVWKQLEFQTAHTEALKQEKVRVIIVLYGDIVVEKLDKVLQLYLKANTYVEWGDTYFWNKLKYALPHYKRTASNDNQESANVSSTDDKSSLVASPGTTPPVLALDASAMNVFSLEEYPRTVENIEIAIGETQARRTMWAEATYL